MATLFPRTPLLGVLISVATAASSAFGENPPPAAQRQAAEHSELQQRLRELDSPCYETRRLAAARVERWLDMPEMSAMLAEQFQQLVVQPDLPLEVRWRISIWRTRLPPATSEPPQSVTADELERLARQLDDDSYSVRSGACQRLQWMAASEHLAKPIMLLLKRRLADPSLCEDSYRRVEAIRNIAWGTCLGSDATDWNPPPVSNSQIDDWLDILGQSAPQGERHAAAGHRIARQELLDVLAQDREVPRVKAAIEAHLRGKLDREAAARLRELLDLTRPALVAERWSGRTQTLEQHLVVGQPMFVAGYPNPSHFDRADDQSAHCVRGNALTPGDYPVGVAFPPPNMSPNGPQAVFQLVNLPTPRRQIAYSYYAKTDPAARLAKLSRRTLDRLLAHKALLSDSELRTLGQLDVREVSRFASRYFTAMKDGAVEEEFDQELSAIPSRLGSQSSCFGAICAQLALDGTQEAVPGLLEAIRQNKFRPPTPSGPYRLQWLAAFSIARRDPWPGVDAWLAENIDNQQAVSIDHDEWGRRTRRRTSNSDDLQSAGIGHDEAAEIGATAAGLLLARHAERPAAFGLQVTVDARLAALKVSGFRYAAAGDVQRVRQWWMRQSEVQSVQLRRVATP